MRLRKLVWLGSGVALIACAQLGGFEDFTPGSSAGGDDSTSAGTDSASAGTDSASAGTDSASGGVGAGAGKSGSNSKGGAAGGSGGSSAPVIEGGAAGSQGVGGQAGDGSPPATGGAPSLLDDCVLLMHFEEASWSMKTAEVKDSSGLGNHGTATAAAITTSAPGEGKFGRAAKLDGSGAVLVPDAASLRPDAALTVAAWIYPTTITSNGPGIVSKRRGFGSDTAFALFLYDSPVTLFADLQGEDDRFHGLAVFLPNVWHHVALVYDGSLPQSSRSRLYVDGQLDTIGVEHAASLEPYTADLSIGELPGGGERFIGMLDEVAVWTRALSPAEIQEIYAASAAL